jgi:hypothetical protein
MVRDEVETVHQGIGKGTPSGVPTKPLITGLSR